ncbi:MAG: hypothetical protein WC004_01710 [Candidatus Absconditabacterales bacterium]
MKEVASKTDKLYDLLHALGKKRSIELMGLVKKIPRSYTELQKELGINSKLVSTKLKELLELRILKKEGDKYDLSKLGKKIFKKIKPLAKIVVDFAEDIKDDGKRNHSNQKVAPVKKKVIPAKTKKVATKK